MFSDRIQALSRKDSIQRPGSTVGFFVKTQSLIEETERNYKGYSLIDFQMASLAGAGMDGSVTLVVKSSSGSVPEKYVDPKQDSLVSASATGKINESSAEGMFAHVTFFGEGTMTPTVTGYHDKRQPINATAVDPNQLQGQLTPLQGNLPWDQMNASQSPINKDLPSVKDITTRAKKDPVLPTSFNPKTGKIGKTSVDILMTSQGTSKNTGTIYIPTGMYTGFFR